jgi:glycosyltransferase involved in cell wall biosynthesis
LAGGLSERGWSVSVVIPEDGPLTSRLHSAGASVHIHPLAVLRRRLLSASGVVRLGIQGVRERSALAELCRGCSLVHSNTSVILAGGFDVPHVIHVREIYAGAAVGLAARAWPLWRRRLQRADALVCVSGAVAAQFDRAAVIHDGIAFSHAPQSVPTPWGQVEVRGFAVGILGRIADWKGQDVLIRALAEPALAEIGATAVIAGDAYPGEEAPDIQKLATDLGVNDRVQLLGFRTDPEQVLASVDAVAVPSTRPDPFPNSALEALTAGKPVVAAAHGGLPEMIKDGETGLLVEPGNPAALATALRRLADDPAQRNRMGQAAAADARNRFGVERMLDQIEAVYAQLGVTR